MTPSRRLAWMLPLSALALMLGILLGRTAESMLPGLLALAAAILAALLLRSKGRQVAVFMAVLALGCVRGFAAYHPALPPEGTYLLTGTISEEFRLREDAQVRTILRDVSLDGQSISGGAYWTFYLKDNETLPPELVPGCRVTMQASVYHPGGPENPGGYDFREYLLQQGVTIGAYGRSELSVTGFSFSPAALGARIRYEITQRLISVMGEEGGRYAATMMLGARHLIPEEDREAFNRLGIAHILSVSGYHVGVLAFALAWLLGKLQISLKLRTLCTGVVLTVYCLITGANPPVVRAALLSMLALFGRMQLRQNMPLHLLSCSAVLMLLVSPAQLTSASFQLSYGAMLGIALVTPMLEWRFPSAKDNGGRIRQMAFLSIGAQIGVLLPQLYWFHELPIFSLPVNVLITGGLSLLLTMFWIVLALLPLGPLASLVGSVAAWLTHWALELIRFCGQADFLTIWTKQANLLSLAGWALLLWSLSLFCSRGRKWYCMAGAALLCLSLLPLPHTAATYTQLSVGDADAALLHDHDTAIAIDTGEDSALAEYLHQRRLSLDALILTHLHMDHVVGVEKLLAQRIPVRTLYLPEGALEMDVTPDAQNLIHKLLQTGTKLITIARGDVIDLPSGSITVLWPEHGRVRLQQEANEYSAVLLAEVSGTSMLLTGDISGYYEQYSALPADVLKLAHHGSASSTSPAFLEAVAPQMLLLSCSKEEREAEVAERMGDIPLYATCSAGAITLEFTDQEYTVRTLR